MAYVNNLARIGDWIEREQVQLYNRTGATLNHGDVVAVDILMSATESTSVAPGGATSGWANAIPMATANIARILACVIDESGKGVADNELGNLFVHGVGDVEMDGNTTLDAGEKLVGTNGETYLSEWATGGYVVGILLEDAEATPGTKLAYFNGFAMFSEDT